MKKYYYTTEYMGPMDDVHIAYVNRFTTLNEAEASTVDSDSEIITEEEALEMMEGEEWETDEENTYCVLSWHD